MLPKVVESPSYRWWATSAAIFGNFCTSVEQGVLAIAIPSVAEHFDSDIPTSQWIFLAFFLTLSVAMLPAGRLSDTLGRKRIYGLGIILFVAGGTLLFFSPNLITAILSKGVQGIGAGMITANTMAIPVAVLPASERGKGLGLFAALGSAGGLSGLVVGGLLISTVGWRFAFMIPAGLGTLALVSLVLLLDDKKISTVQAAEDRPRFDITGATLSAVGLLLLLFALSTGQRMGWTSPWIMVALGGSLVILGGFVGWELRVSSPMLDLRLFRMRPLTIGTIMRGVFMFATTSVGFLMPFYLQGVMGLPAERAGLVIMTGGISMMLVSPFGGSMSDRYGRKIFVLLGLGVVAVGFFVLAMAMRYDHLPLLLGGLALQGIGSGLFISPNLGAILGNVEPEKRGVTTAMVNLVRTASNLVGVAAAAAIVSGAMLWRGYEPRLDIAAGVTQGAAQAFVVGAQLAFLIMGMLCVLGAVVSFFVLTERQQRSVSP